MKRYLAVAAIGACSLAAAFHENYTAEAREPIHYTFSKDTVLDIDNVNGTIKVTGDNGNTIRVEGEKLIRAIDQNEIQRAREKSWWMPTRKTASPSCSSTARPREQSRQREPRLFMTTVSANTKSPITFVVHVPRTTEIPSAYRQRGRAGDDTAGKFDLKTINGGITMTNIAGSGSADALQRRHHH